MQLGKSQVIAPTYSHWRAWAGNQRDYIRWLLEACAAHPRAAETILTEAAIDRLATEFRTPLHIQRYLNLMLEEGYQVGALPCRPPPSDRIGSSPSAR